jgi:hypothetical protein
MITTPDAVEAEPALLYRLRTHFGQEPAALPVVEQQFAAYERANLHLALAEMLVAGGRLTSGQLAGAPGAA